MMDVLAFDLPAELEAGEPPEARGLARDEVRLMISYYCDDSVVHTQFRDIVDFLDAGDVLVINTSGTMNAAVNVMRDDDEAFELHLSTQLPDGQWVVEIRQLHNGITKPFYNASVGEVYRLPLGGKVILEAPYSQNNEIGHARLWTATLSLPAKISELVDYLDEYGFPIRYSYVNKMWPNAYYQTVYATEMGSAEMPSAGRAFTPELITRLVAKGVQVVPLILHTGVASLEDHEPPYEEYYRVPQHTADIVNKAHTEGKRIIAVGTTVVRALESVTNTHGFTNAGEGWTELVITPRRGIHSVNAMLTGLHEPHATHLAMLEALTDRSHLQITYREALSHGYLWHEFGDLHLILP